MRFSTASLRRFRFSLPFARCILNHAAAHKQINKSGMRTLAAALPEIDFYFVLDAYTTSGQVDLMDKYGVDTQEPTPMNLQLGQDSHIDVLFAMDTEMHFPKF